MKVSGKKILPAWSHRQRTLRKDTTTTRRDRGGCEPPGLWRPEKKRWVARDPSAEGPGKPLCPFLAPPPESKREAAHTHTVQVAAATAGSSREAASVYAPLCCAKPAYLGLESPPQPGVGETALDLVCGEMTR